MHPTNDKVYFVHVHKLDLTAQVFPHPNLTDSCMI